MRLHEVAKVLGVPAKALMMELEKHGFKFKTHMAVLEDKNIDALAKKYPDIKAKLATAATEIAASEEEKVRKPRATKAKSSKVVTSRTVSKKGSKDPIEDEPETGSVEIFQRSEGDVGTVTLEQKVVASGVVRRRRVENLPTPPAAPTPAVPPEEVPAAEEAYKVEASAPQEPQVSEPEPLPAPPQVEKPSPAPTASKIKVVAPEVRPTPPAPVATPAAPKEGPIVRRKQDEPAAVQQPAAPKPPAKFTPSFMQSPSGRNLSSPSRLRIVETPAQPTSPPVVRRPAGGPASASQPGGARVDDKRTKPKGAVGATPTEGEDSASKEGARKKASVPGGSARGEEAPSRLTKRDLMGLMEEVEVTRPFGRRAKKPHKMEKRQTQITTPGASKRKIRIENEITVADLADRMGTKAADVIRKLISMGQMATMHQLLDFDTSALIASEYGYEVQNIAQSSEQVIQAQIALEDDTGALEHRAPIVTIMGHVDHGKTSLLDHIRKTRVAAGEAGGITQHIGAYQVQHNGKLISFIDTPGHAAFTAMRARGASITDIVILVVAADEGVKPQTLEALAHAQAAKVPVIVAINKMDKPEANPDRVIQELSGHNLVPEAWGGDTIYCKISAHSGLGIPELLESILLQAEVLDLKANPNRSAKGVVTESRLDKGKGPVATAIVRTGTLSVGAYVVCGTTFGRVRALFDHQGKPIQKAGPSTPVEILGFESVPNVGDALTQVAEDAIARRASELAQLEKKKIEAQKAQRMSLEDMYKKMQTGEVSELRVILKGDVQGSLEAIADSLLKIKHDKVKVNIIFKAVGAVSESDVDLAAASGAIIFGFNVRPTSQAKALAANQGVQIKSYEIIYELIDEVKQAMGGLLAPITKESMLGHAEVREVFTVSKIGPVAGCFVKSGKILRNANARLIRDNVVIYSSKIGSLRRFKDDTKEVAEGFECGIRIEGFTDIKAGDIIECFESLEIKQAVG